MHNEAEAAEHVLRIRRVARYPRAFVLFLLLLRAHPYNREDKDPPN